MLRIFVIYVSLLIWCWDVLARKIRSVIGKDGAIASLGLWLGLVYKKQIK